MGESIFNINILTGMKRQAGFIQNIMGTLSIRDMSVFKTKFFTENWKQKPFFDLEIHSGILQASILLYLAYKRQHPS